MTDTASVAAWYDANAEGEHGRLQQFGLEFAISLAAISQCIARIQRDTGAANLEILDLGGGTGRYCKPTFSLPSVVCLFACTVTCPKAHAGLATFYSRY